MKKKLSFILAMLCLILGTILVFRPLMIEKLQVIRTNRLISAFEKGETTINEDRTDIIDLLLKLLGEYEGSGYDVFTDEGYNSIDEPEISIKDDEFSILSAFIPTAYASSDSQTNLEIIGKIVIPCFNEKKTNDTNVIMNKITNKALKLGVGHYPDSADFGAPGNCVIFGHRTINQFYHVNLMLHYEDYDKRVLITDLNGTTYVYEARSQYTVFPSELYTTICDNGNLYESQLTLITCSPKETSDGRPRNQRLIVICELVETIK